MKSCRHIIKHPRNSETSCAIIFKVDLKVRDNVYDESILKIDLLSSLFVGISHYLK